MRALDVLIFRHGIAHDRLAPDCPPDPDRALTSKGWSRTRAAAAGIATLGLEPQLVLTSPYLRARQTAECALEAFGLGENRLRVTEALLPEADPDEVCDVIDDLGVDSVVCCGHAPNLDEVVAHLVGTDRDVTSLKKAALAWVTAVAASHGAGQLVAVIPPRVLRSLASDS